MNKRILNPYRSHSMHSNLEKIGLQFLFFFQRKEGVFYTGEEYALSSTVLQSVTHYSPTKQKAKVNRAKSERKRNVRYTGKKQTKRECCYDSPSLSLFLSVLVSSPYSPNRLPSFAFFLFAKKNRLYPTWSSRNKKRKQYRDRNYRVSGKHVTLAYSIYRPFPISSSLQPKKIEGAMAGSKEVCFCLLLILVSLSREHPSALLSSVFFLIKR